MAIVLMLITAPVVTAMGVYHYAGYMAMVGEPRYDRLAREQEENR